jgi:hypothetical protein
VFVGAGGAEAGADRVEVGVGVARVADEFPNGLRCCWRRHGLEECAESGAYGIGPGGAGGEDANRPGGSGEACGTDTAEEAAVLGAEGHDGGTAKERRSGCGAKRPGGFEGIADGWDSAGAGGHEERAKDAGEKVRVLVGVDVGDVEPGGLEASDLRDGFRGDVFRADAAGEEIADKVGEGGPQLAAGRN